MENGSVADYDGQGSGGSSLVFLGTGCSSAVPYPTCLIRPSASPCGVCIPALSVPPELNPNYRCNTSLLIDYCSGVDEHKYIIIDVGKTFREQVVRWFTRHKIPQIDAIILTHEHADAILGLDDIRLVQPFSPTNDINPMPIYLSQHSMDSVAVKFPYLVPRKKKEGEEVRRVAQLEYRLIESDCKKPFTACGLQFVPLPVVHGEDYLSLGFLFGEKSRIAYVSDVSRFPESTEYIISKSGAGQVDLLILDCLYKRSSHNTHLCLPQTLESIKRICPRRALLVGMTHEFDHIRDNLELAEWSQSEREQGVSRNWFHDLPLSLKEMIHDIDREETIHHIDREGRDSGAACPRWFENFGRLIIREQAENGLFSLKNKRLSQHSLNRITCSHELEGILPTS